MAKKKAKKKRSAAKAVLVDRQNKKDTRDISAEASSRMGKKAEVFEEAARKSRAGAKELREENKARGKKGGWRERYAKDEERAEGHWTAAGKRARKLKKEPDAYKEGAEQQLKKSAKIGKEAKKSEAVHKAAKKLRKAKLRDSDWGPR